MRINVKELEKDLEIDIKGDEPWLEKIYDTFKLSENIEWAEDKEKNSGVITGAVKVSVTYATVIVRGHVSYVAPVSCSICTRAINWPIHENIEVGVLKSTPEFEEETELSAGELDDYYLEDDTFFDLELAINDAIQTAVPMQTVKRSADGNCAVCKKNLEQDLTADSNSVSSDNPFSVLKDFKPGK